MRHCLQRPKPIIAMLVSGILVVCVSCKPQADGIATDMTNNQNNCTLREELNLDEIQTFNAPPLDTQALMEQDQNLPKDAPLRFADSVEVDIAPDKNGTWTSFDDDTQTWRLRIVSPGALSISIGFTTFHMPAGGCLYLYPPNRETILGPYTDQDNNEHAQLWTPTLDGEEVVIEISIPRASASQLRLTIGFINRGYKQ
jgi:lysyl endopeptidase